MKEMSYIADKFEELGVVPVVVLENTKDALPLAKEEKPGEYAVTVSFHLKEDKVWAEAGHEVAFGQYVYQVEEPKKTCPEGVKVIRSTHNIGVRGAHFEVLFSVLNGGLVSYKYAGKEMIEAIPKPNFWRAPTDNDCGNLMQMRYAQWKIASMYLSHKYPTGGPYPAVYQAAVQLPAAVYPGVHQLAEGVGQPRNEHYGRQRKAAVGGQRRAGQAQRPDGPDAQHQVVFCWQKRIRNVAANRLHGQVGAQRQAGKHSAQRGAAPQLGQVHHSIA